MKYSIEKVATLIGARRYGQSEGQISWLLTDSRSLCFPEETLFFALRTQRNDGHRYIDDLYRRGVRQYVVEKVPEHHESLYPDANFLRVPNTLAALQRLAERHRDEFLSGVNGGAERKVPIVGITGSNGKTMVKEWLYQLLLPSQKIVRSPRSYNSQIGVPLSVWLLNEQTEVGIFEAGISQPGEMSALRDIIQPTIGVLTSLGTAHQENFRSMEEKCMEKLELMHDTEAIVYCSDNDIVSRCIRRMQYKGEKIAWSRYDEKVAFFIKEIATKESDTRITYVYQEEENTYTIPFIDEASIENAITCAAVALRLGLTPGQLADRMPLLEPVAMRLEVKEGQRGCVLINDSYNSDVNSLDIALDFMQRRCQQPMADGRHPKCKTLILSDIYQSGTSAEALYTQVSELAVKRGVERFIGIGPELTAQADRIQVAEKAFFTDVRHFLSSDIFAGLHDEIILLKGARSFGFDQITEQLEQKVHETILEVNLNAMVENLNHFRSFLKPETKMVCMIKADGYGAGAVEIAKTLQEHRVDYLAVAVADEGVTLRKAGITANIMIMNPEMTAFKTMFDYDLEPEVYSFRLMDALIKAARKEGITGWPVHVKFDTGMHRLGFDPVNDIDELIERLKHQNAIIPRSVFSHFVGSDSDGFDDFSAKQFALFDEGSKKLQAAFGHKILRHMDNSAGIEHFPERQMDMCRLGIGLYGVDPRDNHILHTVSTLKTTILQLRHVPAGETVGYSRKGKIERDSVIAAIPIGYADGLNRHLGNRHCYCLVNGQKAEYVGNICMDVAMIDVTDIPCAEGDQVEIFGEHLPVTVLSDTLDTIPYEVLTGVSNRVKRIYFQD
ncbi:bifunctional UDP-N-acetylmuramoyl-tripeptide:D-alanyl-D-alanine ligase/alanine racemase [Prevotella sp. lc2012]|uniref:bifunctional UDP-N-acetylmuramoyl-tripeptide:D-alanyl-D-alanine ligase/alanine racemase n=1 Tax=Prevotella sp. lc2012 TaxID=1761886 RepID=UPI00089A7E9C|nr:bifunctional UDP-N-acetylmuramoyl-tripeptide:D-alanyl-D-alanine ligase/alanine racemase [Prevotella sp. lc2012]SEE51447.1 alanine racemase [Prevotella sp. lc2012]